MKRVICLYRVSTTGQVDHDDIPMQRIACREYAATHSDWTIVEEFSEKGVSGYKVSANDRDAIIQIKKKAVNKEFDVLLVFMFDRLGRREDETPFVVQWFVQQGIEVWSTREGEQRFDSHVDKLLNYIRFWQASGESEKTAIRIRTRQEQMLEQGQYHGGLLPYGYRLVNKGRTNKKNQPVRDLEIDEDEASVVRMIFHLLVDQGYGTNRVAKYLNEKGIKTKRGKTLWRGTSIRAMIDNPIYIGHMHLGDKLSPKLDHLQIIDDEFFKQCQTVVKGRCSWLRDKTSVPKRTDTRSLLSGFIFCASCGSRLYYSRGTTKRQMADGSMKAYEREYYRCYKRTMDKRFCKGKSSHNAIPIEELVIREARRFLAIQRYDPETERIARADIEKDDIDYIAFRQAQKEFMEAEKQAESLENEAVKALTGDNSLDISIVNKLLPKYRMKAETSRRMMEEARSRLLKEKQKSNDALLKQPGIMSLADLFDNASRDTQHMTLARLVDRIEVGSDHNLTIKMRISAKQYIGET